MCQRISRSDFHNWLTGYYTYNANVLIAFAVKKCRIRLTSINIIFDAITNYIYNNYTYNFPDVQGLSTEIVNVLANMRQNNEYENMESALINDIVSGFLFAQMRQSISKKFQIETLLEEQNETLLEKECNICFESYKSSSFVALNCKHEFCSSCIKKSLLADKREKPCCAFCRTEVKTLTSNVSNTHDEMSNWIKKNNTI